MDVLISSPYPSPSSSSIRWGWSWEYLWNIWICVIQPVTLWAICYCYVFYCQTAYSFTSNCSFTCFMWCLLWVQEYLAPEIISHFVMHGTNVAEIVKHLITVLKKKNDVISTYFLEAMKRVWRVFGKCILWTTCLHIYWCVAKLLHLFMKADLNGSLVIYFVFFVLWFPLFIYYFCISTSSGIVILRQQSDVNTFRIITLIYSFLL